MKILHIITSLRTGGSEHLVADLLPCLRDKGNHVELLVFEGVSAPFRDKIEAGGITVHQISEKRNVYHPLNAIQLASFLRKNHYDIIHTHNTPCQLYAPIAKMLSFSKAKLVTTEHSTTNRRRDKRYLKWIDVWMYARYKKIICVSNQTKVNLEKHIGQKKTKIVTIFNGVETRRFLKPIRTISKTQRVYKITMVSAFRDPKDQDTLVRAIQELPPKYKLQLVGDGERRNQVERLVSEWGVSDRVKFMGDRFNIPQILAKSDIVVLSSHWEGLSLSGIEGMSSGRPFIASDVDGLNEIVEGYGVLFPHGDHKALAHEIQDLCNNLERYRQVAERCQERAKQFDISIMTEKYEKLYQELID